MAKCKYAFCKMENYLGYRVCIEHIAIDANNKCYSIRYLNGQEHHRKHLLQPGFLMFANKVAVELKDCHNWQDYQLPSNK